MAKDVTLTVDGLSVTVPAGTLLVEAAKLVRTDIPVYCYHPKLGPAGLCRICLVEVEKTPKLQIACNTIATEGMVVHTHSDKANDGRRAVLEFLLLNHPLDCPICDKGGECDLQDFAMAYGAGSSRLIDPKFRKPKAVDLGPTIVLDEERCIVCQRCTRFDDIITGERSLVVMDRGHNDIIATATGDPYVSDFSGNVTELCPVGALTSKTYRFKSRPWDLRRTLTACQQCSVGCAQNVDVRHGEILRTMSDPDDERSDGWLCDRGRYNVGFYRDARRLTSPLLRSGDGWAQVSWDDAIALWAAKIGDAIAKNGPASVGALGGGRLLNDESYLLQHVFRALGVNNLDWRAGRQRTATPSGASGSYLDLERAQTIVVAGRPPWQTAPILDLRIRKAVMRGGARLFVLGPVRSPFVSGLHVNDVSQIPLDAFDVERIAVVHDGIDMEVLRGLNGALAGKQNVVWFVPGEQPNARGAEAMGMLPRDGGLDGRAMLDPARAVALDVLSLHGVNPVLHAVDGPAARAALARIPFVVVSELFMTPTAQMATLVLPVLGSFEKGGRASDLTGATLAIQPAVDGPAGVLSDGEMLVALAAELLVQIPSPPELADFASAAGVAVPMRPGAGDAIGAPPRDDRARGGIDAKAAELRVAFISNIFAGGGTVAHDDRIVALLPATELRLGPRTAAALEVRDGDLTDLAGDGERRLEGLGVRVDEGAEEGVAIVVDGLPSAPANVLGSSPFVRLTNIRSVAPPAEVFA